ncbi:MAG TPA: hypothetical protein VHG51_10150 [Longimicrobiaceae bacterium]|nr:hypothetical protein [Longimicrobiaceae bacterium]
MTTTHDDQQEARSSTSAALTGLGVALVWLAIVAGISYYLALPAH